MITDDVIETCEYEFNSRYRDYSAIYTYSSSGWFFKPGDVLRLSRFYPRFRHIRKLTEVECKGFDAVDFDTFIINDIYTFIFENG